MGQYVAAGILNKIFIDKSKRGISNDKYFVKNNLEKIIADMNMFIDTSKYNVTFDEDTVCLQLDLKYIKNNLKDLLKEMRHINSRIDFIGYIIENDFTEIDDNFMKKHKIKVVEEDDQYVIKNDYNDSYESMPFYPFYWMVSNDDLFHEIDIRGCIIPIWIDEGKFSSENQTHLLIALNRLKTKYFKSELSKSLIFEVLD